MLYNAYVICLFLPCILLYYRHFCLYWRNKCTGIYYVHSERRFVGVIVILRMLSIMSCCFFSNRHVGANCWQMLLPVVWMDYKIIYSVQPLTFSSSFAAVFFALMPVHVRSHRSSLYAQRSAAAIRNCTL